MAKFSALLCTVLVVCLVACGGESETVQDTPPDEVADTAKPATSTSTPPPATPEPPTNTPLSPTANAMEVAMTEQAQGDMATPLPTWTPWPTPSTQTEVTWDGNECVVTGPSVVPVGYHEFIWRDLTGHGYGLAVRYLHDGYTYQDLLDVQGGPGKMFSRPSWVEEIDGRYKRDDTIGAEVLTYHLNRGGNYDIHFWDTNSLWVCGGLTALDEVASDRFLATSVDEVIGTWQAGGGRFILFDDGGLFSQARYLSQLDDQPYAVSSYRFDGSELLIVEVSVSGVPSCGNAAAQYEVELLEYGNIQLTAIQDDCVKRAEETAGVYEPVS